jgi:hypothetical protein
MYAAHGLDVAGVAVLSDFLVRTRRFRITLPDRRGGSTR